MKLLIVLAAMAAVLLAPASPAHAVEDNWFTDVTAGPLNPDGSASNAAAARPYELTNHFTIKTVPFDAPPGYAPQENLKNVKVVLPPGNIANSAAYPRCPQAAFPNNCPKDTIIGSVTVKIQLVELSTVTEPVFNLEPPPGMPLQFGFQVLAPRARINFTLRNGTDYGATAEIINLTQSAPIYESTLRIWGDPADPSHDAFRGGPYPDKEADPLLSNPTRCGIPQVTEVSLSSWQHPETFVAGPSAETEAMTGCNEVEFSPTFEAKPTTNLADSPSGLEFHLHVPQNNDPDGSAVAHLRDTKVKFPPSLTLNASSANGLGSCSLQQIGYTGLTNERQFFHFDPDIAESFTLEFGGETTPPIVADADSGEVRAALESLPGLAGNVKLDGAAGGWGVTFVGDLAGTDVPTLNATLTSKPHQILELTGEGGGFNLQTGGEDTETTWEASFGPGEVFFFPQSLSREIKGGQVLEGPGLAPGTRASNSSSFFVILDRPTAGTAPGGSQFRTVLPFNASALEVQTALERLPSVGSGNVIVHSAGIDGPSRAYNVVFVGALSGTEPLVTTSSHLTGIGATIGIGPAPTGSEALDVATIVNSGTPQFNGEPAHCPDDSKIASLRLESEAVVDHPLNGSVYLATPHHNPYGSLVGLYMVVADPATGVFITIPGKIDIDPHTGQLTAAFEEAPQLPFEDLRLEFLKGAVAPLKTGIGCGTFKTTGDLTPWSAPEGAVIHKVDSFTIEGGAGKTPCSKDEASAPKTPRFEAGTLEPEAGAYSPFNLRIVRDDGTQRITSVDTKLPRGLLAKLAGIPYCSDAALAAAASKPGTDEQASPSCPGTSRIGSVTVGAGAGPSPYYAGGNAYLAGPYKGAPLSLAVITPAVAGPFDLGTVVIRNALHIDPVSAEVRVASDPIPSILEGIPLDLRSIVVSLDRAEFTKNPTSCAPLAFTGSLGTLAGQSSPIANHFQVGDCGELPFKPKLALSVKGGVKRRGHPALKAVLTAAPGQANIARAAVALPKSELLDNAHIKTVCTRVQFAAGQCPPASIYGFARATTPLLDAPIQGPVYLRSSDNKLPDLVADLHGQIDITLSGRIDTTKAGGIRATFEEVPDAPVSQFVLEMQGGSKGLLQNNGNLCARTRSAIASLDGQNAKTLELKPKLVAKGCHKKGSRR